MKDLLLHQVVLLVPFKERSTKTAKKTNNLINLGKKVFCFLAIYFMPI